MVGLVHAQSNLFDQKFTINLWPTGSHKHGELEWTEWIEKERKRKKKSNKLSWRSPPRKFS